MIIAVITFHVGYVLFKNGRYFLLDIFNNDKSIVDPVNNILLVGYYIVNLGYALLQINKWETISSYHRMIEVLAENIGTIMLFLAAMHYFNILVFSMYKYFRTIKIFNSKI